MYHCSYAAASRLSCLVSHYDYAVLCYRRVCSVFSCCCDAWELQSWYLSAGYSIDCRLGSLIAVFCSQLSNWLVFEKCQSAYCIGYAVKVAFLFDSSFCGPFLSCLGLGVEGEILD